MICLLPSTAMFITVMFGGKRSSPVSGVMSPSLPQRPRKERYRLGGAWGVEKAILKRKGQEAGSESGEHFSGGPQPST